MQLDNNAFMLYYMLIGPFRSRLHYASMQSARCPFIDE